MAIATWEWPAYFAPETKTKGIRMTFAKWKRPSPETAPTSSKAAGLYMICTLSKHAAENDGYADALMLDWRGQIAEATGANVFLAQDGKLHTPKPDCFLNGITRQTAIELARKRGIEVIERAIMPDELAQDRRGVHHRHGRRGDAGRRDRTAQLPGRADHPPPDGGLRGAGQAAELRSGAHSAPYSADFILRRRRAP